MVINAFLLKNLKHSSCMKHILTFSIIYESKTNSVKKEKPYRIEMNNQNKIRPHVMVDAIMFHNTGKLKVV